MPTWRYIFSLRSKSSFTKTWVPFTQIRNSSKSPKVGQKPILQGALGPPLDFIRPKEKVTLPPLLKEVSFQQKKFADCVLLTKVGNFYEMYFEQAEKIGPLLNLRVSKKKTSKSDVSMAGFPFFKLDRYLKILVEDLKKCVALSEEVIRPVDDLSSKNMYIRSVTRVITPGTLIDENFMNPYESNYILTVVFDPNFFSSDISNQGTAEDKDCFADCKIGLSWLDLSTGEFFTQDSNLQRLAGDLTRISPREIVLDESLKSFTTHPIYSFIQERKYFLSYVENRYQSLDCWNKFLEKEIDPSFIKYCTKLEVTAGCTLISYIADRLQNSHPNIQPPIRVSLNEYMIIGESAMKGLEIRSSLYQNRYTGSLLHAINKTVTKSGSRLLTRRLCAPSTNIVEINNRLDLVEKFKLLPELCSKVINLLKKSNDTHRILQHLLMGRGNSYDLLKMADNFSITKEIHSLLSPLESSSAFRLLLLNMHPHDELKQLINNAVDENALMKQKINEEEETEVIAQEAEEILQDENAQVEIVKKSLSSEFDIRQSFKENWVVKSNFNNNLRKLHEKLQSLFASYDKLQEDLSKRLGKKATLRKSPAKLYYVHLKLSGNETIERFIKKFTQAVLFQSTKSTASFQLPGWTSLGMDLENTKLHIHQEEQRVLKSITDEIVSHHKTLRSLANALDELDISTSLATLAQEQDFVRPVVDDSHAHTVIQGRHPIVEKGLSHKLIPFTPNDCFVGNGNVNIWLITGPNMAGKSTFLRQNAIISILAQIGSFVPASNARIGIVDQIFSRIGSADNLYQQKSTFMVEMMETSFILKNATRRSFVIMDEIGRGTTASDGIAIAYGCLKYLSTINHSRTLFATHAHQLTNLTKSFKNVECYCTNLSIDRDDHTFSFDYKLKKGVNYQSHGLKVAEMAGIPKNVLLAAEEVLTLLPNTSKPTSMK
ncbi:mitochondrial MutS protein Msh1 [Schizosaccharomyces pombe]|uniref:MutS protein homolog 1 n=1 Tax=Schizosaccharomyces pombe (strain 972 / ATCC 24843) TaxID=284812 RepID=MSH1_SCHPO|nr:mismatch repair ATPase msh1 [Schizosaccharomyces pombe]O13921.2 RecName: Full=MutS protein homolog 1 [Schizosaccharomyces pombe 972h-]CAB11169.2 mitochondrial MutS protein Msh1 (predicted) [Schizosaccharomyces pombe]|eukprot:NP_593649.2 mismatch repair ATPase msh1 [Schizosaccharomyces pombe]